METFSALLALCAGNSPVTVNSPHKGQWRGALMFSLICVWINDWVNNREAGELTRHHYDVTVMQLVWDVIHMTTNGQLTVTVEVSFSSGSLHLVVDTARWYLTSSVAFNINGVHDNRMALRLMWEACRLVLYTGDSEKIKPHHHEHLIEIKAHKASLTLYQLDVRLQNRYGIFLHLQIVIQRQYLYYDCLLIQILENIKKWVIGFQKINHL